MDRYEYNVRLEQIRSLAENQEFYEAMVIADSIDWRKVRSVRTLSFISEIYKVNKRYEEARDILLLADSRCPDARSIIYALCELSIRMGDLNDSVSYLKEYMELAPQDPSTFVLQYKFYDFTNVGINQRIEILEQLKNIDYQERWGYELAKLYSEAGEITKCVDECDRLILWFGHGRYVTEAMKLKMRYAELTPEQQQKYDHRDALEVMAGAENLLGTEEEERAPLPIEITDIQPSNQPTKRIPKKEISGKLDLEDIKEPSVNLDKYSTMNLQAELKQNMEDLEEKTGELLREKEVPLPPMRDEVRIKADTDVKEIRVSEEEGAPFREERPSDREDTQSLEDDDVLSNRIPLNISPRRPIQTKTEKMFSELLTEQYDGQMSFNLPEDQYTDDKQITGQLSLEDLMSGQLQPGADISGILEAGGSEEPAEEFTETETAPAEEPYVEEPAPSREIEMTEAAPEEGLSERHPETPAEDTAEEPESEEVPGEEGPKERPGSVMRRETVEITADLTGLLRQHRERVNARKQKQEEEEEEANIEVVPSVPEDHSEPEETAEAADDEYEEEEVRYVAPKAQEVQGFDDEEKEIFAQFLPMHDLPDLIRNTLDGMRLNGKNGNVFITGNEQSARVNLANALARGFMHEHPEEFVGKIATIPADLFNTKNVPDVLRALDGCALLIQHAADLTESSLEDIRTVLTSPDTSIILILEETKPSLRGFGRNKKKEWFDEVFDVKIDIPTYTNDDLVFHGREYAREQEYIIDDMGVLALYTKIDERQTADHFVTIDEVEEIVDRAIRHVNRKTPGHFIDVVVGKRYDDDDMIIIREKDFV